MAAGMASCFFAAALGFAYVTQKAAAVCAVLAECTSSISEQWEVEPSGRTDIVSVKHTMTPHLYLNTNYEARNQHFLVILPQTGVANLTLML